MTLLEAQEITVRFRRPGRADRVALSRVSLSLAAGEAVGLIGESGSGKSTLARVLLGLQRPDEGAVTFDGVRLDTLDAAGRARLRRRVQMVFQDAAGALNPRQTAAAALAETLTVHRLVPRCDAAALAQRVADLLGRVGLPPHLGEQVPRELSGGQCQRVCIARALALEPVVLIADEPVSALDVSVQARILRLLAGLRHKPGLALLLIAHDLAVVRAVCDRVVVLREGEIVEQGEVEQVLRAPKHAYTRELLAAVPDVPRALAARRAAER